MLKEKLYKVISPNQNEDVGRKSAVPNDHTHEKFKVTFCLLAVTQHNNIENKFQHVERETILLESRRR